VSLSVACLLDANSLVLLIKKLGDGLVPKLGSFRTLDPTTYEIGNTLWKEFYPSRNLTREEVASLASTSQQIPLSLSESRSALRASEGR
jgi:hypothetical protein